VITSAGAGSAAAIAINADLVQDDVERAVADFTGAPFSAEIESGVTQPSTSDDWSPGNLDRRTMTAETYLAALENGGG
jgi:hypothetical protein